MSTLSRSAITTLGLTSCFQIHARLGEVTYVHAKSCDDTGEQLKFLANAMRHFCRSIELCNDYLRGYYGLKLVSAVVPLDRSTQLNSSQSTNLIIETFNKSSKPAKAPSDFPGDLPPPSLESVQKLNQKATAKLSEIVRRGAAAEKGWDGYDAAELQAARELVAQDAQTIQR